MGRALDMMPHFCLHCPQGSSPSRMQDGVELATRRLTTRPVTPELLTCSTTSLAAAWRSAALALPTFFMIAATAWASAEHRDGHVGSGSAADCQMRSYWQDCLQELLLHNSCPENWQAKPYCGMMATRLSTSAKCRSSPVSLPDRRCAGDVTPAGLAAVPPALHWCWVCSNRAA